MTAIKDSGVTNRHTKQIPIYNNKHAILLDSGFTCKIVLEMTRIILLARIH